MSQDLIDLTQRMEASGRERRRMLVIALLMATVLFAADLAVVAVQLAAPAQVTQAEVAQ